MRSTIESLTNVARDVPAVGLVDVVRARRGRIPLAASHRSTEVSSSGAVPCPAPCGAGDRARKPGPRSAANPSQAGGHFRATAVGRTASGGSSTFPGAVSVAFGERRRPASMRCRGRGASGNARDLSPGERLEASISGATVVGLPRGRLRQAAATLCSSNATRRDWYATPERDATRTQHHATHATPLDASNSRLRNSKQRYAHAPRSLSLGGHQRACCA